MRRTFVSRAALLLVLAAGSGCASAPTPGTASRSGTAPIGSDELGDPSMLGNNILQAVRQLRPAMFNDRGVNSFIGPSGSLLVSINGRDPESLDILTTIPAHDVAEVRYMSASDAAQRFGTRSSMGPLLLVKLR